MHHPNRSFARLASLAVAGLTLSACFDRNNPGELAAAPGFKPLARIAAPGTPVTGSFTIPGGTVIRESGPGINEEGHELGECLRAGAWKNPASNVTGTVPHPHCVSLEPEITVTLNAVANYVTTPSGNVQLNFSDCGEGVIGDCAYVHYNRNQNTSGGSGGLIFGSSGKGSSTWSADLSLLNGEGNVFDGRSLSVRATNGIDSRTVILTW